MTPIETQLLVEWRDAVISVCQRDTGRTPAQWLEEMAENDEHRQRLHRDLTNTLSTSYRMGTSPESVVLWLSNNIFRDEELTSEYQD